MRFSDEQWNLLGQIVELADTAELGDVARTGERGGAEGAQQPREAGEEPPQM